MQYWQRAGQVLVIGLGQIGYHNAEYFRKCGIKVDGYDIEHKAVERALQDDVINREAPSFEGYDYYVICVSTNRPDNIFQPSYDGIINIAQQLSFKGKSDALVSIESTITKGTTNIVRKILNHRLHVVHVPHRFYAKEKEEHGVKQIRVLGGCEECCTKKAVYFYNDLLKIPLHVVTSVELAELCKIVENSYRFLEISFAEELKMFCDSYAIDFDQLRDAINSKWNIEILEAEKGIGGHCLPKDTEMYVELLNRAVSHNIIDAAKKVDHLYKMYLAQRARPKISIPLAEKPLEKIVLAKKVLNSP